jgi:hypothetical protein
LTRGKSEKKLEFHFTNEVPHAMAMAKPTQ